MSLVHGSRRRSSSGNNRPSANNPSSNNCLRHGFLFSSVLLALLLLPACSPSDDEQKGTENDGHAAGTAAQNELLLAVKELRQQLAENAAARPRSGDPNLPGARKGATETQGEATTQDPSKPPATGLHKTGLQQALLPFKEAFEGLLEKVQEDRRSYRELALDVRRLGLLLEEGLTAARNAGAEDKAQQQEREEKTRAALEELQKLRTRLDRMEKQLAEREKKHAEEKQLLIRALDASSKRLEALFLKLSAPGAKPSPGTGEEGAGKKDGRGEGTPNTGHAGDAGEPGSKPAIREPAIRKGEDKAGLSRLEFWLLLALPAVVLGVLLVVFFPRRLSPVVPRVEFQSGVGEVEEAIALHGRGQPDDQRARAREIPRALEERVRLRVQSQGQSSSGARVHSPPRSPAPEPAPELATEPGPRTHKAAPRMHSVELAFPSKRAAAEAAKPDVLERRLQSFLEVEPRVLRRPAPRLCCEGEKPGLQFYTQPSLSTEDGRRLEAALRRHLSQPSRRGGRGRGSAAAW